MQAPGRGGPRATEVAVLCVGGQFGSPLGQRQSDRAILLVALVLVLELAACVRTSHSPDGGSGSADVSPRAVKLVVELMNPDPTTDAAEQRLVNQCLEENGFATPPTEQFYPRARIGITGLTPFGLREARRFGFALRIITRTYGTRPWEGPNSQDPAYQLALDGPGTNIVHGPLGSYVSSDGCRADARRFLYGSLHDYLALTWFPNEVRHYQRGWIKNPKARVAARQYLGCMGAHGYRLDSFGEVFDVAARRFPNPVSGSKAREEREMAMAEATCERSSGVWPVINQLALDRLGSWLNSQELRISDLSGQLEEVEARADLILGEDWTLAHPRTSRFVGGQP